MGVGMGVETANEDRRGEVVVVGAIFAFDYLSIAIAFEVRVC
jgi:hypothetical protein